MTEDAVVIEEDPEPDNIHQAFFEKLSMEEQRRYVCLDMARLFGSLPDKAVDLAKKFENYMRGKGPRPVDD